MILAIETSAEPASIALTNLTGEIQERTFANENQVNIPLTDQLKALLTDLRGKISIVLVGAGPGSYSGARVGLATAEAIAMTHGCQVVTLPSILGLPEGEHTLVGDARRGSYFHISTTTLTPTILTKEEFANTVAEATLPLFTFENPEKLPLFDSLQSNIQITSSTAQGLIKHWLSLNGCKKEEFLNRPKEIIYLRPPNITKAKSPF